MAGYFRKLVGRVYDGAHYADEDLTNGLFVCINASGKVEPCDDDSNTTFRCVEKTYLYGKKALVIDVLTMDDEIYMVENDFPVPMDDEYDEADYVVKDGALVKMKRPLPGEQIVLSVSDTLYAAVSVGDKLDIDDDGVLAKVVG